MTMSSHNPQSSFARRLSPLPAAAIGRGQRTPPSLAPATFIVDHQNQIHRPRRGVRVGDACELGPADRRGRGRVLTAGISSFRFSFRLAGAFSAYDCCPPLTRRLLLTQRSRHFFRVRVGSSRRSAIQYYPLERHSQCLPKRHECHSVNSVAVYDPGFNTSHSVADD